MNIGITDKVKSLLLQGKTKVEISNLLDIERITLDRRLKNHKWKRPEIKIIEKL